jgi:HAE1 family hydrophobic/amphiphilic exporter-1
MVVYLTSPNGTYDATFLANYAYINLVDAMTRVPGIASVTVFGAGQYATRIWVNPNKLASLSITVPEIVAAIKAQNTVNPAGQIGAEPIPSGQAFTNTVRAQGRLVTEADFGNVVLRANVDGSLVRVKDVARVELGAQNYSQISRVNGKPATVLGLYQLPGTNAIKAVQGVRALMKEIQGRFPADLEYGISLDTTEAVTEGIHDIYKTLVEAMILVIIVVFIFLQGWRATLIPLVAVPVSLVGTFMVFPLLGFTVNTLSLLGLVLAIGLVVDDAIVVVEAVELHIEHGLSPREATIKAMDEVSGPVIAIALILAAVFIPTAFVPGITGRLYQQFALTIAISVIISAFNALTLSPALSAMLLRPRKKSRGPLGWFFNGFNFGFLKATDGYIGICRILIRRSLVALLLLGLVVVAAGWFGKRIPAGFLPDEDQGYLYANLSLPDSSSLERTDIAAKKMEDILTHIHGIDKVTTIVGFSLLSSVTSTYNAFFFVTLHEWKERKDVEESVGNIMAESNRELASLPDGRAFVFPPPAIPGIGTSGGVTMMLEDRSGQDVPFLAAQTRKFIQEASKRPEIARITTTFSPEVPQIFIDIDRDKVVKQGVELSDVYKTLQTFMGGLFVNYFNRFGRQWQVYVQAEGAYRTDPENLGQFFVLNKEGKHVPLSAFSTVRRTYGPEFTQRYNLYRCTQLNVTAKRGYSSLQVTHALEDVFAATMPKTMGYDYLGMSFQEKQAEKGVPPAVIFGLSFLFVFLILAAQYESWALPFSVLFSTPVAVMGAFAALFWRELENNVYAQIGLVMLIGLAAKNAILIVEFARAERAKGRSLFDASLEGARLRLRPILMTSFAFILGCVPLWTATGAGAVSRQIIGTAVIGGMGAATAIAIFLIPALFYFVERLVDRKEKHPTVPPAKTAVPESRVTTK